MKGTNTITLNTATMIELLEHVLPIKVLAYPVKVNHIKRDGESFTIAFEPETPEQKDRFSED